MGGHQFKYVVFGFLGLLAKVFVVLEKGVFVAFEDLEFLSVEFSHFINCFIDQFDHVEFIEPYGGILEVMQDAGDESMRHIDTGLRNLGSFTLSFPDIG
jgi:hypothetical protein